MKTKSFQKKLVLKKDTISNLNDRQMEYLYGKSGDPICALTDDDITCPIDRCKFTNNDNTCPVTACYTGVWCD